MSTQEQLAISLRPKNFKDVVGSSKLLKHIRKRAFKKKAWLLIGSTGYGKTTIARIMAVSLQCKHQRNFGDPCERCHKKRKHFDIVEIPASILTGKKEIQDQLEGWNYVPKPGSRYRVYFLDEIHRLSTNAQDLLLPYLEDCPRTTKFILATSSADQILPTVQRRCTILKVPGLDLKGINKLVRRGLRVLHSDRSVSDLAERLYEKNIDSPGLILNAVEKYYDKSLSADEATEVIVATDVDAYTVARHVCKGNWEDTAKVLSKAREENNTAIRIGVAGYLHSILLAEPAISARSTMIAKSILELNRIGDSMSATAAVLYKLCKYFVKDPA